jgi:DNA-binding transcriptional LysR family regulator
LAAAELNVSVPAIAFQVRQVEDALGARLIRRSGRSVAVTDEGVLLALELREGFGAVQRALSRFQAPPVLENVVTVSVLSSFASLWLLPRLPEFGALHPDIDVRISTSERRVDLEAEGIDCAVRSGVGGWKGLSAELLFPQLLAPLCHWSYVERFGRPESPASIPDRHLIVNSVRPVDWSGWFAAAGVARGEPKGGQAVEGRELVATLAHSGVGVGLLDISLVQRELRRGDLIRLFPEVHRTGWSHWLVAPSRRAPKPACRQFMDWLISAAASEQAES